MPSSIQPVNVATRAERSSGFSWRNQSSSLAGTAAVVGSLTLGTLLVRLQKDSEQSAVPWNDKNYCLTPSATGTGAPGWGSGIMGRLRSTFQETPSAVSLWVRL